MRWGIPHWFRPRITPAPTVARLAALGTSIAATTFVLGGIFLIHAEADTRREAERALNRLAMALSWEITRTIDFHDLFIQGIQDESTQTDHHALVRQLRYTRPVDHAVSVSSFGTLQVIDETGRTIAGSEDLGPCRTEPTDTEAFKIHRNATDVGLFMGLSGRGGNSDDESCLIFSRRIARPDGTFGGAVLSALPLAYFGNLFGKFDLGSNASIILYRRDGHILMRLPSAARDRKGVTEPRGLSDVEDGTEANRTDDAGRLCVVRHLPGPPLALGLSVCTDDPHAHGWRNTLVGSLLLILPWAFVLTLMAQLRQQIRRRIQAENTVRKLAEQMATIATTDALTGLPNRRAFDARLSEEWLRSIRARRPITLLMLDLDYFGLFNNQYGHAAGDDALRSISACIVGNVRRPGDIGARYGEEEFAVLLPETDRSGALCVAERIRLALKDLDIPHAGRPEGHVTASIGVAIAYPLVGDSAAALVNFAEMALFAAKNAGRNRIHAIGGQHLIPSSRSAP
jgi:diguanylate cyclase (GGDEF)-like protein